MGSDRYLYRYSRINQKSNLEYKRLRHELDRSIDQPVLANTAD